MAPVRGGGHDNPLAFLDWESVDPGRDIMQAARGSAVRKGNFITPHHSNVWSCVVAHHPRHRWAYLSQQQPHELWLFKQGDSRSAPGVAKQAFHTSFRDPTAAPGAPPRRAIAVRIVCAFEPLLEGRL